MAHHLLGIDLGTSSVRTGVFREDGIPLGIAVRTYPISTPSPGRAEQDPNTWWQCTCECIKEAFNTADLKGSDITGISFSGQMHGAVLLDRDGKPVVPAIIWADTRSADFCCDIEELIGDERLRTVLMNRMFPGTQAMTLYWIQEHDKDVWRRTRRVLLPKDYLRYRMCGLFNTEPSDASGTLLFDVNLREWSDNMLNILGIPIEYLPYVVNSDQRIGETEGIENETGIPDGVPVIMGGGDQPCAALGNGIINEGAILVTIGTGGQVFAPIRSPQQSPGLVLNTFCHLPESRWYVLGATLSAGMSLQWYRDTFCIGTDFENLVKEASHIPPGAEGLMFLPCLEGKRSPELNPSATAAFSGIRLIHTRGHFVRAIMEGVAFELRENFDVMTGMGIKSDTVICSGGAAKSPTWMQILADIFNRPVSVSAQDEPSCFGAALLAGIGTGVYGSYLETVEIVKKPKQIVDPILDNSKIYAYHFKTFKKLYHEV